MVRSRGTDYMRIPTRFQHVPTGGTLGLLLAALYGDRSRRTGKCLHGSCRGERRIMFIQKQVVRNVVDTRRYIIAVRTAAT